MTPLPTLNAYDAQQAAKQSALKNPAKFANVEKARKASIELEAFFVTQMMEHMWKGIKTDGPLGGGNGEQIFRSMMLDEYGRKIAEGGNFGISDAIMKELIATQEVNPGR